MFGETESMAIWSPGIPARTRIALPTLRLPRNPLLYAFVISVALHIGVAAVLTSVNHRPVLLGADSDRDGQNTRFAVSILLAPENIAPLDAGGTKTEAVAPAVMTSQRPSVVPPSPTVASAKPAPQIPLPVEAPKTTTESTAPRIVATTTQPNPTALTSRESGTAESAPTQTRSGDGNGSTDASAAGGQTGTITPARVAYLHNPSPDYPRGARERGWQGTTVLRVEVLADGTPNCVEIVKSSGHHSLDAASIETVRTWKFLPARRGEKTISSWVEIPIRFQLLNG